MDKRDRIARIVIGRAARTAMLFVALAAAQADAQPAAHMGTPGTTIATAVVLPGIDNEFHGVAAEQAFVADHFPTWHIEYQTRITQADHSYDVLGMVEPDKTRVQIFFDITAWVGK